MSRLTRRGYSTLNTENILQLQLYHPLSCPPLSLPPKPRLLLHPRVNFTISCDLYSPLISSIRMKFGKSLNNQIEETLPEWRDKFLFYKELKKKLKLVEPKAGDGRPNKRLKSDCVDVCWNNADAGEKASRGFVAHCMSREEDDFIQLLEAELEKFNNFFVEKEEEYIIRLKELQDRVAKAMESEEEMMRIRKEIVDFHGEMVLLENYSALNYTGIVKILKKYDKRTGALLRIPFVQKVLQQPFCTTDLLYKLVKECEATLDHLFPSDDKPLLALETEGPGVSSSKDEDSKTKKFVVNMPKELPEIKYMESMYMKGTIAALRVLKEVRSGSSTVSVFSLPPLQINGLEDTWKTIPLQEQVAK